MEVLHDFGKRPEAERNVLDVSVDVEGAHEGVEDPRDQRPELDGGVFPLEVQVEVGKQELAEDAGGVGEVRIHQVEPSQLSNAPGRHLLKWGTGQLAPSPSVR